jgi:hypothetical protein
MGQVVLVVPLPARNPVAAHMVKAGRTVLGVPLPVLAVLMAQDQMARAGQRVARPLRKGHLDHTANQISTTRREISTTRRDSAGRHGLFELRWLSRH